MKKIKLVIGDWSKDGHNQSEDVIINCNKSIEELQEAYKKSCLLAKIQFTNNENLTGLELDRQELRKHQILVAYQSWNISEFQKEKLLKAGIKKDLLCIEEPNNLVSLILEFIKLSLVDLDWKHTTSSIPVWNTGMGYGLFE